MEQFINNRQGNNVSVQRWYDSDVSWTPAIVNQLQQFVRYSPRTVYCGIALPGHNLVQVSLSNQDILIVIERERISDDTSQWNCNQSSLSPTCDQQCVRSCPVVETILQSVTVVSITIAVVETILQSVTVVTITMAVVVIGTTITIKMHHLNYNNNNNNYNGGGQAGYNGNQNSQSSSYNRN